MSDIEERLGEPCGRDKTSSGSSEHRADGVVWFELPDGKAIVPFADAIAQTNNPHDEWSDDQCYRIKWKDNEYLCMNDPHMTVRPWTSYQHPCTISQPKRRDILPTPLSVPRLVGGSGETHPMFKVWCIALLSTLVDDEGLFRFSGHGKVYTLVPPTRSLVPLQKVHIGPGAIPTTLADKPCGSAAEALRSLNEILGTAHALEVTDGLAEFLEFMIGESRDFGELYGRVRPWWFSDTSYAGSRAHFEAVVRRMRNRKANDDRDRSAIIQEDSYIPSDSHPPPRHIWDLFSNCVLPYYAFRSTDALKDDLAEIDERLWTVSHSWVAEEDREDLWTNINGRQWPVPFPRATTLEHVRVELLNTGAEYVWLDVLCLRQKGRDEDEPRRLEEWKIDVPTIGFVYQGAPSSRYCIIYLNGLGLPCTADDEVVRSPRHWFHRAWTVQEAVAAKWLPGGLTVGSVVEKTTLGRQWLTSIWSHLSQASTFLGQGSIVLPKNLKERHCTNELDRVAVISYCLHKHCKAIPVYNLQMSPEHAWETLIKHFLPHLSTSILINRMPDRPFSTRMSMADFVSSPTVILNNFFHESEMLVSTELGEQVHLVTMAGPFYISQGAARDVGAREYCGSLELRPSDDPSSLLVLDHDSWAMGVLLPDVPYTLANVRSSYADSDRSTWVVLEALPTGRTLHGVPVVHAIKWGIIAHTLERAAPDPLAARGSHKAHVVYVDETEAVQRSAHAARYVDAFEKMVACGRVCTFADEGPGEDAVSARQEGRARPERAQEASEDKSSLPESEGRPPRKGGEHEGAAPQARTLWFDRLRSLFCCLCRS